MRLLLDTHTLIWFINGDESLPKHVIKLIENPENDSFVSIASLWEIAIKISLGKLEFKKQFQHILKLLDQNGFQILPISFAHTYRVSNLEFIHRDPFDRIIVAQSIEEKMQIITKDRDINKYQVETTW